MAWRERWTATSAQRQPSVSVPSLPAQRTKTFAPSSAPRSIARIVFCSAYARTSGSFAVKAPSRKTGWKNRLTVAMGTTMWLRSQAFLKAHAIWSRCAGVASIGTRALSRRFTPHAPTSPKRLTSSGGDIGSRTASPNGSRPRFPTVQRPKVNLCSGLGSYFPFFAIRVPPSKHKNLAGKDVALRAVHAAIGRIVLIEHRGRICVGLNPLCDAHDRGARLIHRSPHPRAHARQQGGTVRGSLFGLDDFNFVPVN